MPFSKKLPFYFLFPLLLASLITMFFVLEKTIWPGFQNFGIYPRQIKGIKGILTGLFIHQNVLHWFNNIMSFLIMSSLLYYIHPNKAWKIIIYGSFLSGALTWLIGRPAMHIGMSGLNYVLFSFLLFTGFFSKDIRLTAISFILIFLYGGLIWLLFPVIENISWEAHLSGFLTGIFFTYLYLPQINANYLIEKKEVNIPPEDDFMLCFDDFGNFIEKNTSENKIIENS